MHIIFILTLCFLFGASLYLSSLSGSIACSLILLLLIWTRLFSNRIIKKNFSNLTLLEKTKLHHFNTQIQNSFSRTSNLPKPEVYLDPHAENLQLYCFGKKRAPQIITSRMLIEELSSDDLDRLLNYTGVLHSQNLFTNRQPLVALFVYIGGLGKWVDTTLSFVLGIKTKNGEPKALVRKPLYFLLSKLNFMRKRKTAKSSRNLLKDYSYLSLEHKNPVMSPLSITDQTS